MIKITAEFIRRHISFDGSADEECPHCKKVISYGTRYIDHKWELSWVIAKRMGFGEAIQKQILEIFDDDQWNYVGSNEKYPYKKLAKKINKMIFD